MVFFIQLAECCIEIHSQYELVRKKCAKYIVEPCIAKGVDFIAEASRKDMLFEEEEMQEDIWRENGMYFSRDPQLLESAAIHRKVVDFMLSKNTFLMHGSVVAKDGIGFMFSGKSGIGKTTRTQIWLNEYPDSIVVNGDKPLLRVSDTDIYAYGTPWCGKEDISTNICVPLRSIFFLERAETDMDNSIKELRLSEALSLLLKEIYLPERTDSVIKVLKDFKSINGKIAFYKLRSAPTAAGIHLAYMTAMMSHVY